MQSVRTIKAGQCCPGQQGTKTSGFVLKSHRDSGLSKSILHFPESGCNREGWREMRRGIGASAPLEEMKKGIKVIGVFQVLSEQSSLTWGCENTQKFTLHSCFYLFIPTNYSFVQQMPFGRTWATCSSATGNFWLIITAKPPLQKKKKSTWTWL